MTSALLSDYFQLELEHSDREERFMTSGVSWSDYESLLEELGDRSSYCTAYLLGSLELMSPSRSHELDKKAIARLLEAYFEENRIRFWGLGSTTLRNKDKQAGKEPDDCYCVGTDKDIPDLAIEVVYSSGGIDTLKIYQRLGVLKDTASHISEVWFWQDRQFAIYCLQNGSYQQQQSKLLPDLNLGLLAQYVDINDPLEAIVEWRKQIKLPDDKG